MKLVFIFYQLAFFHCQWSKVTYNYALNEYYYVKGDPGDKVCFPKHIIKTSHGHIYNVSRASIKNIIWGL